MSAIHAVREDMYARYRLKLAGSYFWIYSLSSIFLVFSQVASEIESI